jgi:hypothetical protein
LLPALASLCCRFRTAHLANDDGTFGPADEARKYLTLLDLQRRAFSLQVRCVHVILVRLPSEA